MKKFFSVLLPVLTAAVLAFSLTACEKPSEGLDYELNENQNAYYVTGLGNLRGHEYCHSVRILRIASNRHRRHGILRLYFFYKYNYTQQRNQHRRIYVLRLYFA